MRLFIVRHAQAIYTRYDSKLRPDSHAEISYTGKNQIFALKRRLETEQVDIILSSPAEQAYATASELAHFFDAKLDVHPLLIEKSDGDWEQIDPHLHNWDSLEGSFDTKRPPNGESLLDVHERSIKLWLDLLEKYSDTNNTIMLISHPMIIKVFLGMLLGMTIRNSVFKISIDSCSITQMSVADRDNYRFEYIGEKGFLA